MVTHNTRGQVLTSKNALNHTTTLWYDTLGNLTSMQDPLGNTTTRAYDGAGRMVKQTDAQGRATGFSYDVLNQLRVVADVLNGTTRFTYDANGNLLSLTDARGNTTNYAYNSMDRVTTRTDPLTRAETYGYDNNGNLQSVTDRKSQTTNLTYDALNRVLTRTSADTSTLTHTWDVGNRLTQAVDSISGTITRTYHPLDGVLTEATPNGTVTYTYDTIGRRATMAVPGQATITYAYDNANRLTTITQDSNVVTLDYDTADRRTKLTYPSGTFTEYAYDNASRLTGLTYKHGTNTLGALTYGYDATSQRSQSDGTWARVNRPPALNGATYDAANRQLTFGGMTLTYDYNGNLTGDGTNTYTWSARDQLASLSGPLPASFVYDGLGRRQRKTVNGTITDFIYDGLNPVRESVGASTVDLLTTLGIDEYLLRVDATSSRSILADSLGSTVSLADAGGAVQTEYTYEPFGAATVTGATSANEFRFTGREDDATAVHYYRARYYHPGLQRFIAEDALGFVDGTNLYAYALNSPLNFTDPMGLYTMQELTAIIYNETSGLRGNLTDARVAIAHVAVNRERLGMRGGIASTQLSAAADLALQRNEAAAVAAYLDALQAASLVLSGRPPCGIQDPTRGALHFILDYGQRKPSWARGVPRLNYGPFINAGGGGDVPRRATVYIQIYP